jgi:outer membrane protein OmpA-like peptidoglycan-associated protein
MHMKSFARILLFAWCAAALLGLAACSQRSATTNQTAQTPGASAAMEQTKKIVAPVSSATTRKPAPTSPSPSAASASPVAAQPQPTPDESLALALKQLGAQHSPRGEVLRIADLTFAPGQTRFKAGVGTDLKQVVALLHKYPDALLIIDGYTDNRGGKQLNEQLSLQRAKSVQQALLADGLKATRIRTRGLGSADPVGDNGTREGRDENRRVELVFSNSAGTFASAADQVIAG